MDPLWSPGACGAALADKPEALVAAEPQCAAQLSTCQAVHRAINRVAWRAAIGRCKTHTHTNIGVLICTLKGDDFFFLTAGLDMSK